MKKNKLLPCPWCGEIPEIIKMIDKFFNITHRCKIVGPITLHDYYKKDLIKRWNKRSDK